jgi:seryl-tRNA synthetase
MSQEILELDVQRRDSITKYENLLAEKNQFSKQIEIQRRENNVAELLLDNK